jgi:hypothetical protein
LLASRTLRGACQQPANWHKRLVYFNSVRQPLCDFGDIFDNRLNINAAFPNKASAINSALRMTDAIEFIVCGFARVVEDPVDELTASLVTNSNVAFVVPTKITPFFQDFSILCLQSFVSGQFARSKPRTGHLFAPKAKVARKVLRVR